MKQSFLTEIITILGIAGIFISLLAAIILFFRKVIPRLESRMLALFLIVCAASLFVSVVYFSSHMIYCPWLFRTGSPVHYLIPVFAWLYVRTSISQELRLKKYDWLLFVPAILHFLEFLPFYLMPYHQKLELVRSNYTSSPENVRSFSEGILPPYFHPAIKVVWAFAMNILQWDYFLRWKKKTSKGQTKVFYRWLLIFNVTTTVFYLSVTPSFLGLLSIQWIGLSEIILALFVVAISVLLFFFPSALYGFEESPSFPEFEEDKKRNSSGKSFDLPPHQVESYQKQIEAFIIQERPFLRHNYTIKQMGERLDIPLHHLSFVFNKGYGLNFSEFINRHRIDYILKRLDQPEWRLQTLESLAVEAGFNARNTFFLAFKKVTGLSPSEYLRQLPD